MNKEFWRGDKRPFQFQYLILPLLVFASIKHRIIGNTMVPMEFLRLTGRIGLG
jgi:integral membrane sensor domain MASE1